MESTFCRTERIIGRDNLEKLKKARVAVFGVGGVGGYVVEALARSGVGKLDLIDSDEVCLSNINRQILALHSNIGRRKVDVAAERVRDINPDCQVQVYPIFYLPETKDQFDFTQYDYVVDAIDTVSGKIALVEQARDAGTPIICSMGAGNKMDPTAFRVADIYQTKVCPLARVMRQEMKKRGIKKLKVVYSEEKALSPCVYEEGQPVMSPEEEKAQETALKSAEDCAQTSDQKQDAANIKAPAKRVTPGSISFVPSVAGLILAGEVVRDLISFDPLNRA
ncbi:MAG: tRNA threonylcarbamoyladenosine dehydratase [Lachnospiraceae bacterium]|nr:tRNA threonylcarbamoyladenosine dehydratase [Lachnospiraceae bacterium]